MGGIHHKSSPIEQPVNLSAVHKKAQYIGVVPNNCTLKYNFGALLQSRQSRWSHLKNPYTRPWQIDVNDKFLGYAYARAYGVRTPRLLDCPSSAVALPTSWPSNWGSDFVVKPLLGFSSRGVLLIRNGEETFEHDIVKGRQDVIKSYARKYNASAAQRRVFLESALVVEEMVTPPKGLASPFDLKFFMFGGRVAAVWFIYGRKTKFECSAIYDGTWRRRLDSGGCVRYYIP